MFASASALGVLVAANHAMVFVLLIVLLVLATCSTAPFWGHSRSWGYTPSATAGTLLLIVVCIWFLMGAR
jgi:hypothetical protein